MEIRIQLTSTVLVRIDLHVHSSASYDCSSEPERVAARCRRLGLSPVFLTDHDTIAGAVRLQRTSEDRVVIGEEVMTTAGEIIGLFLSQPIRPRLAPRVAALEIRSQGGLVYLEHPYDPFRRHLSEDGIEAIADLIDIVEVFNGRSPEHTNRQAQDLRAILGVASGAGSDSHSLGELGSVYVEMETFDGAPDFLDKLRRSRIVTKRNKLLLLAEAKMRNRVRR